MGERLLLDGGRFELAEPIGSGGFGTVFRARDHATGLDVAVKLVPHGFGSETLARRLRNEAAILARLSSRHIARIVGSGEHPDAGVWLATELVDGVHLSIAALGRALLPHEVLRVARGMLGGLGVAHGVGIVHGDVKPANVLVPLGDETLDAPKLIDFGLGRVTSRGAIVEGASVMLPREGVVLGSPRMMAPEVLAGAEPDPRADVYAVGLVLFELLGVGALFHEADESIREQLRLRVSCDPDLGARVPAPLSEVLGRMLARDPSRRFVDAREAHEEVLDLDTAPVSLPRDEAPSSVARVSFPPPSSAAASRRIRPASSLRPRSTAGAPPLPRLASLPVDPPDALRETLRHLDLPMLDALARRERGGVDGRIARATALVLRSELDAAALILEPLQAESPIASALGATLLAPCATRATRARVDIDREDTWASSVPVELSAVLSALGCVLSGVEAAPRAIARAARVLERIASEPGCPAELEGTLRLALVSTRSRLGQLDPVTALDEAASVVPLREAHRFDRLVRAVGRASVYRASSIDDERARPELERAVAVAAETGATILDAHASLELGRLLVRSATRVAEGVSSLERACTLLAHGESPRLEHEAQHELGTTLLALGRWSEAAARLSSARDAARGDHAIAPAIASTSLAVVAWLAGGERPSARAAARELAKVRTSLMPPPVVALTSVARALESLAAGDVEAAGEVLEGVDVRAREEGSEADAFVLVAALRVLRDAASGRSLDLGSAVAELLGSAEHLGFTAFHWFDTLRAVVSRIADDASRSAMHGALDRISEALGPSSRLARERRTSAPPPANEPEVQP